MVILDYERRDHMEILKVDNLCKTYGKGNNVLHETRWYNEFFANTCT